VRATYAEFAARPGQGGWTPTTPRLITSACDAAGVELGAYVRRIVAWLSGWEPTTCAVVAAMISRAADGAR